mgnify:CR=1 FL=1
MEQANHARCFQIQRDDGQHDGIAGRHRGAVGDELGDVLPDPP